MGAAGAVLGGTLLALAVNKVVTPAVGSVIANVGGYSAAEASALAGSLVKTSAILGNIGQAGYGLSQGDYTGMIRLGVSHAFDIGAPAPSGGSATSNSGRELRELQMLQKLEPAQYNFPPGQPGISPKGRGLGLFGEIGVCNTKELLALSNSRARNRLVRAIESINRELIGAVVHGRPAVRSQVGVIVGRIDSIRFPGVLRVGEAGYFITLRTPPLPTLGSYPYPSSLTVINPAGIGQPAPILLEF